jgi:rhomboid family GlyGly-CTERM serine protease
MLSFFQQNKHYAISIAILCVIAIIHFLPEHIQNLVNYQRADINNGQWWRWFSGHFAHTNDMHALMNAAALLLAANLHARYLNSTQQIFLVLLLCALTSLGIYLGSTYLIDYVGLSGVLHGLFVAGACKDIQEKEKTGYILLIAIVIKVVYEQVFGASDSVANMINAPVATDAHLWGAISGLAVFALFYVVGSKKT